MRRLTRPLTLLLVALLATSSLQGCYGSFQLTGSLYEWNGRVTRSAFVQQLLFWGLCIIPVYELALVGDTIIFNLLEFWTGSNPIADSGDAPANTVLADGSVVFEREGRRYQLQPLDGDRVALLVDGQQVAIATPTDDGGLALEDHAHGRSAGLSAQELEALRAQLARR